MKYHVVTPFNRFENLNRMAIMLSQFRPKVEWDLLLDDNLNFQVHIPGNWVRTFFHKPSTPFWVAWARHLNNYIKTNVFFPEDRYLILNDDDFYEPEFFDKLDRHTGEVVICSMARGNNVPAGVESIRAHGTFTLTGCPENMAVGSVGCEQMIVSGRIFSSLRFNETVCADGEVIVATVAAHPVDYAPEAMVWFNYLEPGRWNL